VFVLWCSGLPGASAGPGLSPFVFVVVIGLALVFWGSGASARPGVFVFFPWVVVLVFVFWRYGASACFAAFLFLLVAAVGMGPTATLRLVLMVGVVFCALGFVWPRG
jgi:hypothetical protein